MTPEAGDALARLEALQASTSTEDYLRARYDLGLAWPHFRPGCGGLGLTVDESKSVTDHLEASGAPQSPASFIGLYQAAALIHNAGSPDQQQRHLRRIFLGEDQWCQLFSEPGAGSDLANVATRAVRQGDNWRVDGQKVWTSNAQHSDLGLLLARTRPELPKHRGLTLFVIDMRQPGVEVRPLRQADGGGRFSEVFLNSVPIVDTDRLGGEGEGWALSMATLSTERGSASNIFVGPLASLLQKWRSTRATHAPSLRDAVTSTWIDDLLLDVSRARERATSDSRDVEVLRGIAKVLASEHLQRMAHVLAEVVGPDLLVAADYSSAEEEERLASSAKAKNFSRLSPHRFVIRSLAMSIEGGTNQISRNIVGERVLGLPSEPRLDRDKPWKEAKLS